MIKQSDIEKLQRFSKGMSDEAEENYIISLFADNESNKDFKNQIRKEFNEYLENHPEEDYNLAFLLDRIHHTIHKKDSKKKQPVVRKIYQWYAAIAAVILVPLLVAGGLWVANTMKQPSVVTQETVKMNLIAPPGSRISFSLPDGTRGWLNSGSSIEYSLPFSKNRQISVLGEAWFDVAHDVEHPFEVTTGDSKVKVLGTKFNLNAYPEEKYVEIALEKGKVEFFTKGLNSGVVLKPNERLVFKQGAVNIDAVDAFKYAAWKEGKLIFRGDSMDEVARRIGRWYNVDVELMDEELKNYAFRGTFVDDSLEEVLRYLSMTSPIKYRILEREQQEDNTISKKKVLLYKKAV